MKHGAASCNTVLHCKTWCNMMNMVHLCATWWNMLQHSATWCLDGVWKVQYGVKWCNMVHHDASCCNMVHHGTTWYNMMQHGATWCNMVHHDATFCTMLHHAAPSRQHSTWCNMLQHGAAFCNMVHNGAKWWTILHTAAPCFIMLHHAVPMMSGWCLEDASCCNMVQHATLFSRLCCGLIKNKTNLSPA